MIIKLKKKENEDTNEYIKRFDLSVKEGKNPFTNKLVTNFIKDYYDLNKSFPWDPNNKLDEYIPCPFIYKLTNSLYTFLIYKNNTNNMPNIDVQLLLENKDEAELYLKYIIDPESDKINSTNVYIIPFPMEIDRFPWRAVCSTENEEQTYVFIFKIVDGISPNNLIIEIPNTKVLNGIFRKHIDIKYILDHTKEDKDIKKITFKLSK